MLGDSFGSVCGLDGRERIQTMNRRQLLRLAPVAALAAIPIKIGNVEAKAHELQPDKKYVFVVRQEVPEDNLTDIARFAHENGIKGMWLAGPDLNLEIYEVK
jgi:hypothetical protein